MTKEQYFREVAKRFREIVLLAREFDPSDDYITMYAFGNRCCFGNSVDRNEGDEVGHYSVDFTTDTDILNVTNIISGNSRMICGRLNEVVNERYQSSGKQELYRSEQRRCEEDRT